MSERERWIVYPLLFLALGVALRDELFDVTQSKGVVCEELVALQESPVNPNAWQFLGRLGPAGSHWERMAATGQLSVGTIRADTVIADHYAGRGLRSTAPSFFDLWRRPWAAFSQGTHPNGDAGQNPPESSQAPAPEEIAPADTQDPPSSATEKPQ